jgi:Lrp/AsnC family leucine-responsive transcriptional regulator
VSTAIDTLDEQILAELQANGRLTMKALAEAVGLSSPAMIERVRRLEERGVISGYRAIVAPRALGRPLSAVILAEVQQPDYARFLERVSAEPAVVECHRITGEATFLVRLNVADPSALEQFVDALSAAGARCETSLVLSSPVPWRQVTPPEGAAGARTRAARRRRRTSDTPAAAEESAPAARGRGRGRRRTSQ